MTAEFADRFQRSFCVIVQLLPLREKNDIRKKITLFQRVQAMKALDSGRSCRDVVLKFGCGKSQISSIKSKKKKSLFSDKFIYVHVYVHA